MFLNIRIALFPLSCVAISFLLMLHCSILSIDVFFSHFCGKHCTVRAQIKVFVVCGGPCTAMTGLQTRAVMKPDPYLSVSDLAMGCREASVLMFLSFLYMCLI